MAELRTDYRDIRFREGQGNVWVCEAKSGHTVLGTVEKEEDWREYEFCPNEFARYSYRCLLDLADFIGQLNRRCPTCDEVRHPAGEPCE